MHPTAVEFLAHDRLADLRREVQHQLPLTGPDASGRPHGALATVMAAPASIVGRILSLVRRPVLLARLRVHHP